MVSQWEHSWDSGPPSHSPPGAGAPPYLGRPIAMNQDWEGVVSQVPCSHLAHFKLEHHLICGGRKQRRVQHQAHRPSSRADRMG